MFRFRKSGQPPKPKPWHDHAKRCAGTAARGALLGAAAAAKASTDALKWAAERQPPPPPTVQPIPVVLVAPPPAFARPPRPPRPPAREGKSSSKVLPILACALLVGFVVALTGVRTSLQPVGPPAPQNMAKLTPNRLTDYATDNGVVGGAKAALKVLEQRAKAELVKPQPVPPVAPILPIAPLPEVKAVSPDRAVSVALHLAPDPAHAQPKAAVKLTAVKSADLHTTEDEALADALGVAQTRLAEQFLKLDPPLDLVPGAGQVRADFLRPKSVTVVRPTADDRAALRRDGVDADWVWVTADFEVTEEQVRQLRGEHRLATTGPLFLLPLLLAGGLWGFLRLDAWTRGHLTGWLVAVVGAGVVGGAVFATYLARSWW